MEITYYRYCGFFAEFMAFDINNSLIATITTAALFTYYKYPIKGKIGKSKSNGWNRHASSQDAVIYTTRLG